MGTQGVFGYILGKKKRYMHVQYDANMLYDILIRELYILLKHHGSVENLKTVFDTIKNASGIPTKEILNKTKYYSNFTVSNKSTSDWYCVLRNCQLSFINIIDCGFILNCHDEYGFIFTLNFNTNKIIFSNDKKIIHEHEISDILNMEGMPQITYDEIINDVRLAYNINKEKIDEKNDILHKILLEHPNIEKIILTKRHIDSKDPKIIDTVQKKILHDECKYEIHNLLHYGYDFDKRLKSLLL